MRTLIPLLLLTSCGEAPIRALATQIAVSYPGGRCSEHETVPCDVDLGDVEIGSELLLALDVANVSDAPLDGVFVELAPGSSSSFAVEQRPSVAIEARHASPFMIALRPTAPGEQRALLIASANVDVQIAFDANAVGEGVVVDPAACDFGAVPLGETSASCSVTMTNQSATSIDIEFASALPAVFTHSLAVPITLEPSSSVVVDITATPREAGPIFGVFSFGYDGVVVNPAVRFAVEGI